MSSTEQFSNLTNGRPRELNRENYYGNVSDQFSKMPPATCLSNGDMPCKPGNSTEPLRENVERASKSPERNGDASLPRDDTPPCEGKLPRRAENGESKMLPAFPVVTNGVKNVEPNSNGGPLKQSKNGQNFDFSSEVDKLNHLNQQSASDSPTASRSDSPQLLIEDYDTGGVETSSEPAIDSTKGLAANDTLNVKERVASDGDCGEVRSVGSSRNSLHVQFEDHAGGDPAGARGPTARESPVSSLSSESSSEDEDDESSLEDLNEGRAPDGGYGWVVVAAAFLTNLIADGITFTFGIIYVELIKEFKEGKSKTAWIGGIFMAMPLLSGPVASYLADRFGCRRVCMMGAILACCGFVISSQANSIEVLILTFGIISGFGLAMCFVSAVVIVSYYFEKKRSLATGLSVCGSGLGTFVFAPISSSLIQEYGWRGTTLIIAGLLLNITVCGALMRDLEWTKEKNRTQRRDRKMRHRYKRSLKSQSQSLRTANSSAGSLDPARALSMEEFKRLLQNGKEATSAGEDVAIDRQCSSALHLPTFVRTGEQVPLEVLELLSSNQNAYNLVLKNYPGLFIPTRCNSDLGFLGDIAEHNEDEDPSRFSNDDRQSSLAGFASDRNSNLVGRKMTDASSRSSAYGCGRQLLGNREIPAAYLRHDRAARRSLSYRGAMLNVKRYRTRAVSCPDISRNSMVTVPQQAPQWYECFWDLRDVLADMVDVSHFSDVRFLLFALSNFILYSWYHVPYVFIADKAVEMGFLETDASMLISILGILNTVGEILLGWMGDFPWVNSGTIYALSMCACGVVTMVVPLVTSYSGLCVLLGGFGFTIAANYSLASIILVELISIDRFTNAYGLLLFVQGTANLVGPPMAGWMYDVTGDYDLSFYLAGLFIMLCGIMLLILPTLKWCMRFKRPSLSGSREVDEGSKKDGWPTGERERERLPVV